MPLRRHAGRRAVRAAARAAVGADAAGGLAAALPPHLLPSLHRSAAKPESARQIRPAVGTQGSLNGWPRHNRGERRLWGRHRRRGATPACWPRRRPWSRHAVEREGHQRQRGVSEAGRVVGRAGSAAGLGSRQMGPVRERRISSPSSSPAWGSGGAATAEMTWCRRLRFCCFSCSTCARVAVREGGAGGQGVGGLR